jgi:hypothetical protein
MEFDPKQRNMIIDGATKIGALLNEAHETYWEGIINRAVGLLQEDSFQDGIQVLKSMFGGMGSINDLYISPINGHTIAEEDVATMNQQLVADLSRLHQLII